MNTPDYQASPDVWDWDAMPDPTIDELAAASTAGLDRKLIWYAMPVPTIFAADPVAEPQVSEEWN